MCWTTIGTSFSSFDNPATSRSVAERRQRAGAPRHDAAGPTLLILFAVGHGYREAASLPSIIRDPVECELQRLPRRQSAGGKIGDMDSELRVSRLDIPDVVPSVKSPMDSRRA